MNRMFAHDEAILTAYLLFFFLSLDLSVMPQPIKPKAGASAFSAPECLLQRPKLAALIGTIVAEWAFIDRTLAFIFNVTTSDHPLPNQYHQIDPVAAAVFDTLVTFPAKIAVVKSVLNLRASDELKEEFEEICAEIRNRSKERNTVVHASWSISDQYPDDLITFKTDGSWIKYTEKDLLDILARTIEIRNKANDFSISIANSQKKQIW